MNLSDKTLIFVGTVPLAAYHAPTAPSPESEGDFPAMKTGFVVPSTDTTLPPLPESHLYPNLRKDRPLSTFSKMRLLASYSVCEFNLSFSAPPSYEETMHSARSLRERGESEHVYGLANRFAPRYPMYNFASAQ